MEGTECGKGYLETNDKEGDENTCEELVQILLLLKKDNPQLTPKSQPARNFQCSRCSGAFVSAKGLSQHIGKKHNATKKQVACPDCDKKFRTKYAVKFHREQVHNKTTRVRCPYCGAQCYNKYTLKAHINSNHVIT